MILAEPGFCTCILLHINSPTQANDLGYMVPETKKCVLLGCSNTWGLCELSTRYSIFASVCKNIEREINLCSNHRLFNINLKFKTFKKLILLNSKKK